MKKRMGRPPKAKVYQGDAALDKILSARPNVQPLAQLPVKDTKEQLLNMRRHLKGGLLQVEQMLSRFTPQCAKCYELYGFLNRCVCNKEGI